MLFYNIETFVRHGTIRRNLLFENHRPEADDRSTMHRRTRGGNLASSINVYNFYHLLVIT